MKERLEESKDGQKLGGIFAFVALFPSFHSFILLPSVDQLKAGRMLPPVNLVLLQYQHSDLVKIICLKKEKEQ